jgi:hypothetical protein
MAIVYKDLYSLITAEMKKRIKYSTASSYNSQLSRTNVSSVSLGTGNSSVAASDLINSIMSLLEQVIPPQIVEGLEVTATDPISDKVLVTAGKGSAGGKLYELENDITLTIPLPSTDEVFYLILYNGGILISPTVLTNQLKIAKVVVPKPGITTFVQDQKDDSWNAYIVNFKEYKLYGYQDIFEEDTVELLRNNISPILADNLIGNIRLSEDLKITNTQGTVELDSSSLKLLSTAGTTLAKFNRSGTFFYDDTGKEIAKFSTDEARIGNILITKSSIQSGNFVSGPLGSGFQISDSGNAEFQNIITRGIIKTSVFEKNSISSIGGNFLISDSDVLAEDMSIGD